MMDSAQSMDQLRALAAALDRVPAARWFPERFHQYEAAGGRLSLDQAFGLVPAPGKEPWWEIERRQKRDAALLAAWQEKFGSMGLVQGAREMSARAHRLQSLGAPREGRILQPGDVALLDAILTGLPIPGPRRLRDIVSREIDRVAALPAGQ